jgi:hypothetical protein
MGLSSVYAGSGRKGIRTPDLLAASQTGLNGVRTSESAGHERAEGPMLSTEELEPLPGPCQPRCPPWGCLP